MCLALSLSFRILLFAGAQGHKERLKVNHIVCEEVVRVMDVGQSTGRFGSARDKSAIKKK